MRCKKCGNTRFFAHQICRMDVVVNEQGNFEQNVHPEDISQDIYDSEKPYGPYICTKCGHEFDE